MWVDASDACFEVVRSTDLLYASQLYFQQIGISFACLLSYLFRNMAGQFSGRSRRGIAECEQNNEQQRFVKKK